MQYPKPPIGSIQGRLYDIQINIAEVPNTNTRNLTHSVNAIYEVITLKNLIKKWIYEYNYWKWQRLRVKYLKANL